MDTAFETKHSVVLSSPERTDLLGLLAKSLLVKALARDSALKRAARMRGAVVMRVGRMVATLTFGESGIEIRPGASDAPRAWLSGSLESLLKIATRKALVVPVLLRRVRFGGNLFLLLRMLFLIRTKD